MEGTVALMRVRVEVDKGETEIVVVPEPVNVIPIRVVICNVETFFMDKCIQLRYQVSMTYYLGQEPKQQRCWS